MDKKTNLKRIFLISTIRATLYIAPAKILKDSSHKIRIAIGHKQETRYIVTSISVKNISDLKKGQISGNPQANVKLRNLLNHYQELLDKIDPEYYSPAQLREYLSICIFLQILIVKLFEEVTHISFSLKLN